MASRRLSLTLGLLSLAACSSPPRHPMHAPSPKESSSATAPEPRSPRRPPRRDDGRRRGRLEHAGGLPDAAVGAVRSAITNSDLAFTRQLRHPGQLQRLPGLGHRRPEPSRPSRRPTSAPPRRATSRSTRTCSSSRARDLAAGSTAARRGGGHGQHRAAARHPDLRHQRHRQSRRTSATCRPAAARTPTRCWWIPRTRRTSTSTSRARARCARPASWRAASALRRRIPTRRCSASRSSRFRWPTRSRPRSSARPGSSTTWWRRHHGETPGGHSPRPRRRWRRPRRRADSSRTIHGEEQVIPPRSTDAAGQHGQGPRRHRRADRGRQRGAAGRRFQESSDAMVKARAGRGCGRTPGRPSATTSPSIRRSGWPAAPAAGYGLLLDISDPAHPMRIGAVADSNFSYWHSATFNNDGSKILFSDEWGGGGQPKCRATDKPEWGADAIFTLDRPEDAVPELLQDAGAADAAENCVAHNGSLIPIPGRDVMVQAWYQGGISVFDWTDPKHPKEIAFFDRGPWTRPRWERRILVGLLVQRRHRQLRDLPRARHLRAAAERVHLAERDRRGQVGASCDYLNTQGQPKLVWPATCVWRGPTWTSWSGRRDWMPARSPTPGRSLPGSRRRHRMSSGVC